MCKTVDTRPLFLLGQKHAPRAYKGLSMRLQPEDQEMAPLLRSSAVTAVARSGQLINIHKLVM